LAAKNELVERAVSPAIQAALEDTPVVCLLGPRQSGKTTLVRRLAPERAFVSLDDGNYYRAAQADPVGFLESLPNPVTLDEVQHVPELLPAIKLAVDNNRISGRFLLTGSANLLLLPKVTESLAGRMEVIQLHPLTEAEKNTAPGRVLEDLLAGRLKPSIRRGNQPEGANLTERLIAGGYPEPLARSPDRARQWHRQYLRSLIERDVRDVARLRDANELARLLELLALRSAQLLNISTLSNELGLNRETVERLLAVLERLFLIRRLPAWHRHAAKRLIKAPKVHFLDSGLACTLAGLGTEDWIDKRELMGYILETFVVQQLMAQAGWTDPDLRFWHYRDKDQVEVDAVITRGHQTWGIEVKATRTLKNNDGQGLSRLAEKCGADFKQGLLLYGGQDIFPMNDKRLLAVPISALWDR
jgi:predicted AAA+ superfamily ATPase